MLREAWESSADPMHQQFAQVMSSFQPGLFVGGEAADFPEDNVDLERWFKRPKGHERRIHGRHMQGYGSCSKVRRCCWRLTRIYTMMARLRSMTFSPMVIAVCRRASSRLSHAARSCAKHDPESNAVICSQTLKNVTLTHPSFRRVNKKHKGEFLFWQVYRIIDGREEVQGYGTRDMPIWGDVFIQQEGGKPVDETRAIGRILAIVHYLQSIQEK